MPWVGVAREDSMQDGQVAVYEFAERRVALCKASGHFYAIDDVCTHDGGPLDQGHLDGFRIECPRHGAKFDVTTGKAVALPAVRPVKTWATRVVDGIVEIEVTP